MTAPFYQLVDALKVWLGAHNDVTDAGRATLMNLVEQLPAAHEAALAEAVKEKDKELSGCCDLIVDLNRSLINAEAAKDKAVSEATERLQAHNAHLQRMLELPSSRKDIEEAVREAVEEQRDKDASIIKQAVAFAVSDVWEEACKTVCAGCRNAERFVGLEMLHGYLVHRATECDNDFPCQAAALRARKEANRA